MFKVIVSDVEAFGREYYTTRRVAFGKSPKQAWAKLGNLGLISGWGLTKPIIVV
jgi:hypothetical protein